MNKSNEIQQVFFDSIRQRLPGHISLVHEIAELLGISYDSAYRRLRGEKNLTIEELKTLSHKYRISVDSLFGQTNADVMFHPFILKGQDGFKEWLKLRVLEVQKMNESRDKELIMVARDLPIYYFFNFPELAAFKIFFWKKMLLHLPDFHDKKFNINELPADLMEIGYKLLSMYNNIPTIEIWCQETFTRIMQQIEFCRVSGFLMHKHDAVTLFEKLEILIRHIQYQTEQGCKFHIGYEVTDNEEENFKVYFNEVLLIDNTILIVKDGVKTIFMTHNSLDILLTTNPAFCHQVEHALKIIMKTGNHISGTAGMECQRIFTPIYEKLEEFKKESLAYRFIL
jgi:transcriptional regulator with XRE-family HTH domain